MTKPTDDTVIGAFRFDARAGELRDGAGQVVALRAQSVRVLQALAARAGELVTKDALMDEVWPETHVTDDSLVQCVSEIRKALGAEGRRLVTVPKRGYRLEPGGADVSPGVVAGTRGRWLAAAVAVAVLLAAGVAWWALRPGPAAEASRTIAVLPFRNDSGDAEQGYLANGVAEDLIVALSRISDLRVVARGTSFAFPPEGRNMREIASALEADVLLEGSVRQVGERLRLTASLVDGATGANLWANAYEGARSEIFDFQEEVLEELVRVLSVRLSRAERARLGVTGTKSVEAHDAYLIGRELENLYTRTTNLEAEAALARAVRLDPEFALAHAHLSQVYSFRVENGWTAETEATVAKAFAAAEKAVALDPDLPFAHFALGRLYTRSYASDMAVAASHYSRAIELDPNYVDAYVFLANILIFDGHADEALPLIASALERNPVPPFWYALAEGMAQYFLGDYEAAEAALIQARDQNPTAPFPHRFLMATYGQMGRVDDAEWSAMEYEALGRIATVGDLMASASVSDPGYREIFAEGFRKAGLPED